MCNYKYKIVREKEDYNFDTGKSKVTYEIDKPTYKTNVPQRLFEFVHSPENDTVLIYFNTGIGALFANNILATEWEWLPFEFYDLEKNAQNFFRRAILIKKKGTTHRYPLDAISSFLRLRSGNTTHKKDHVENILNNLQQNGFIKFGRRRVGKKFIYDITRNLAN